MLCPRKGEVEYKFQITLNLESRFLWMQNALLLLLFICSIVSDSLQPHGLQPAGLLFPWDSPVKNTGAGLPFPSPGDLPGPGIEPTSPALAGGFFIRVTRKP